MRLRKLQDLLKRLSLEELEVLQQSIDARTFVLSRLPEHTTRWMFERNIQAALVKTDGLYAGQVIHCDENCAVLQKDARTATIHCFSEPMLPVPRGEHLELRRIDGKYEMSRDRGRRWEWLKRDREHLLKVIQPIRMRAELGLHHPEPENARTMVPRTHDAMYRGEVLGTTQYHVVQQIGPDKVVAHCRKDFERVPPANEQVSIRYMLGRLSWDNARERGLERTGGRS